MNRQEQRVVELSKKDHNNVYKGARDIWKESSNIEAVLCFLSGHGWTREQMLGYVTNQLEFSLEEGKAIIATRQTE